MVPVQMLGGTNLIEQTVIIPLGQSPTQAASWGSGQAVDGTLLGQDPIADLVRDH